MGVGEKFLLHYHLKDSSHAMDAFVRNKCEHEMLAILHEISTTLAIPISVESEAYQEGGLKEIWRLLGAHNSQITLLLTLLVIVLSRIPISDPEQDELNKKLSQISIEEKELQIKKLKHELDTSKITQESVSRVSDNLNSNPKISIRRSNFYKNLLDYDKVTGIGISNFDSVGNKIDEEKFIPNTEFLHFIFTTSELQSEVIENAQIEIVSPVLKEGNYKWRGIYQGSSITFSMADKNFKNSVLHEIVSFKHGSTIECVLKIHKKLDEIGNIVITGYSVLTVISQKDGAAVFETVQGKRFKQNNKSRNQISLFNEGDHG